MTTLANVMTVTGEVPPEHLGITAMHEHLLIDLRRVSGVFDAILSDVDLAVQELADFTRAGGATVVELTNRNLGRRPEDLKTIAERTGANIIMGCGWYREPYYDNEVYRKSAQSLADDITQEITEGVGPHQIKPGIIGEIGSDLDYISPAEERSFRAAARAHLATGLTISTHATGGRVGLDQLNLLEEEGVPLDRVIVGHCDDERDDGYYTEVLNRGAWVQFDLIRETSAWEVSKRVDMVKTFLEAGGLHRLLLSQDVCTRRHLRNYGGGGYGHLLDTFVPALRSAGVNDEEIHTLLVRNPRAALIGD